MTKCKVRDFIKKLGAPKLSEKEICIVKEHHKYHEDNQIRIIGPLPQGAVFVRVINHMGEIDSVIDYFCYKNDCSEDGYIREASEDEEIAFIKKWLKENLSKHEMQKLKREGKL